MNRKRDTDQLGKEKVDGSKTKRTFVFRPSQHTSNLQQGTSFGDDQESESVEGQVSSWDDEKEGVKERDNSQNPLRQTLCHCLLRREPNSILVHQIGSQPSSPQLSNDLNSLLHQAFSERSNVDVASTRCPSERTIRF